MKWQIIKNKLIELTKSYNRAMDLKKELKNKGKTMVLLYTPDHSNIGDAAIALAEKSFLSYYFPDYFIYEIPLKSICFYGRMALFPWSFVLRKYPLMIHGGGFLGTIWLQISELPMRRFLSVLPRKLPVLVLPQTIYYEDDAEGKMELEHAQKLYKRHAYLKLCTREKYTYSFAQKVFGNAYLIPDMVLFPKTDWGVADKTHREGAILCLRDDIEKTMSQGEKNHIRSVISKMFANNVSHLDMLYDNPILEKERKEVVSCQMNKFARAELIITDRLHGMIFAAITGTPCVVITSKSYKVKGCYDWIKTLGYVKLIDNIDNLENACEDVLNVKDREYSVDSLLPYYQNLAQIIKEMFHLQ